MSKIWKRVINDKDHDKELVEVEIEVPLIENKNETHVNTNKEEQRDLPLQSIHEAVKSNNLQRVQELLESGIDCNIKDPSTGNTALIDATSRGFVDIVKTLLAANVNVNLTNNEGITPLHVCVSSNTFQPEISLLFLRYPSANFKLQEKTSGNTPLHLLAEIAVCQEEYEESVVKILNEMLPLSKPNLRNKDGNTALHIIATGHIDNMEGAKIILNATSDVNIRNRLGETPLMIAIRNRKYMLAMDIIKRCPNLNLRDRYGCTPLHHACIQDAPQVVNCLLEMGSDINGKDFNGDTPLHLAAQRGHVRIVDELLKWDWDLRINMQNDIGYTPLMCAVYGGFVKVVKLLLKWKCDVTIISYQTNSTAFDIAKTKTKTNRREHREVYDVLAKYMEYTLRLTLLSNDSL